MRFFLIFLSFLWLYLVIVRKITQSYFFSPSGSVDIKSNTSFLFDLPLYECVLHNSLCDCTQDLIQVSLHVYVLLTENCSLDLCKNMYFWFVFIFTLHFHQSNENYVVIKVGSFSMYLTCTAAQVYNLHMPHTYTQGKTARVECSIYSQWVKQKCQCDVLFFLWFAFKSTLWSCLCGNKRFFFLVLLRSLIFAFKHK